jgi:formate hydrogenlyase subunit 3/multisubunit Na+/H+ antiporter MnhD subunit
MVAGLLHPLNIFIVGMGGGFLIPILNRFGPLWVRGAFLLVLIAMTAITGVAMVRFLGGAPTIEILTGGAAPPIAINLRLGLAECVFALGVNLIALLGAVYFVRAKYPVLLLYLILVMGIQGMVMTRDLFNLFVFLEIVSIGTYGLLSLQDTPAALSASFKFILATVLASAFFLLGTTLIYYTTGSLNIDELTGRSEDLTGPFAFAALILLLACLLIELKPFPANGWGLDVYETAKPEVAALVSVGVSAGVFFALLKLIPIFTDQVQIIAWSGAITFVFSNLTGLVQGNARRLFGYSSVGQMGLTSLALALLMMLGAESAIPLVVGGLFVNHLFAKAGLFWLAGYVGRDRLEEWSILARKPHLLFLFALLLGAIAGFPPFPGFFAKWHLVMHLAADGRFVWIVIVLLGSLLEAAYLFRWFGRIVQARAESREPFTEKTSLIPVIGAAVLVTICGLFIAGLAGISQTWIFLPLAAGFLIYLLDFLPGRIKGLIVLAAVAGGGIWLIQDLNGLRRIFGLLLLIGGFTVAIASLYRDDKRRGFFPLLAVLLLAMPALTRAETMLEFFLVWELITISCYFLILQGKNAAPHALRFLLFSLVAAFFLLVGFAVAQTANESGNLEALRAAGPDAYLAFVLIAIGLLIKAGAIGVHVWLPGAYAEADDDFSAMLSAVVSKVAMFGLLVGGYVAVRSTVSLDLAHVLGWIGMLTTIAGALMALKQDDIKKMLAYSSMSQIGYIVTAVALMSHLGWVTALYLVANHMSVKAILFLAAATLILRTGTRNLNDYGGLARKLPFTFAAVVIAMIAMSGLPPLTGFGGKWLLLTGMMERGWYWPVIFGLVATFVGFLYMVRFVYVIFLRAQPAQSENIAEAPLALLIPQYLAIAAILAVSFMPKLFIEPLSTVVDPYFASTLRWDGMSLEMIYGTWNPVPTMLIAVAVSALLFVVLWIVQRRFQSAARRKKAGLDAFRRVVLNRLTPPVAHGFWRRVAMATLAAAGGVRLVYTGNGQTYALYVLYYFLALYVASGGAQQFWTSN